MGVDEIILNLLAYDEVNGEFNLKLINMTTNQTTVVHKLETVRKIGLLLSLSDTHKLLCSMSHANVTYLHDPATNVVLTKCVLNFLALQYSYRTLIVNDS